MRAAPTFCWGAGQGRTPDCRAWQGTEPRLCVGLQVQAKRDPGQGGPCCCCICLCGPEQPGIFTAMTEPLQSPHPKTGRHWSKDGKRPPFPREKIRFHCPSVTFAAQTYADGSKSKETLSRGRTQGFFLKFEAASCLDQVGPVAVERHCVNWVWTGRSQTDARPGRTKRAEPWVMAGGAV